MSKIKCPACGEPLIKHDYWESRTMIYNEKEGWIEAQDQCTTRFYCCENNHRVPITVVNSPRSCDRCLCGCIKVTSWDEV